MNSDSKQGLKILIAELALQKRHLAMVREQNSSLLLCDRRKFAALHEQYVELIGDLEIQNKVRVGFFGRHTMEESLQSWPEIDRRNALKLANELKNVVVEAQRINAQNRRLVSNQVKYIDFMLTVLINTFRKGSTYGPQGAQSVNRGNLLFNSAA